MSKRFLFAMWTVLLIGFTAMVFIPEANADQPTRPGYRWEPEVALHGTEKGTHYNPWLCKTRSGCEYPLGKRIPYNGLLITHCSWNPGSPKPPTCGHSSFSISVGGKKYKGNFRYAGVNHPNHRTVYITTCRNGKVIHGQHGHCGKWVPTTTTTTTTRPRPNPTTTRPATTTTTTRAPTTRRHTIKAGWKGQCYFRFSVGQDLTFFGGRQLPVYGEYRHFLTGYLPPGMSYFATKNQPFTFPRLYVVFITGTPTSPGTYNFQLHATPHRTNNNPYYAKSSISCIVEIVGKWSGQCSFRLQEGTFSSVSLPFYASRATEHYSQGGDPPPGMAFKPGSPYVISGIPTQPGTFRFRWLSGRTASPPAIQCTFRVTPTTTSPPATTPDQPSTPDQPPAPTCSWMAHPADVEKIVNAIGWETFVPLSASAQADPPYPEVPGGNQFLVVTGERGSGVFPSVWPVWQISLDLVDTGGCTWTASNVITRVRELFMWDEEDAVLIRQTAPVVAERWNRLSPEQQNESRRRQLAEWQHQGQTSATEPVWLGSSCPVGEPSPFQNCRWGLSHPGVYWWEVSVAYVYDQSESVLHSQMSVASGTSHFLRLVDHAEFQGRT